MQCPNCGAGIPEDAGFCNVCGQRLSTAAPPEETRSPVPWGQATRASVSYAGFWLRLVAYVIDSLVLGIFVGFAILMPLMQRAGVSADNPWALFTSQSRKSRRSICS